MTTVTQEVLRRLQRKIGHPEVHPASNSALGRALKLSHTYVKQLLSGDAAMSREAFVRACTFLELSPGEYLDLSLRFDAEVAGHSDYLDTIFTAMKQAEDKAELWGHAKKVTERTVERVPMHSTRPTRRTGRVRKASSLAGAAIAAAMLMPSPQAVARPMLPQEVSQNQPLPAGSLYIMRNRRPRRRRARSAPSWQLLADSLQRITAPQPLPA